MEGSLSYRFNQFKKGNPNVGDFVILSKAIRGMKYGRQKVYEAFNKYIPKSDYSKEEKDMLMDYLWSLSQTSERPEIPIFQATQKNHNA